MLSRRSGDEWRRFAELAVVEEEVETARQRAELDPERVHALELQLAECERDRAARLRNMQQLEQWLTECEADRAARLNNMNELQRLLNESEAERAAGLKRIQQLERLPVRVRQAHVIARGVVRRLRGR